MTKLYRKTSGIKKVIVKNDRQKLRKAYTESNAALAWELDFKGCEDD